MKKFRILLVMIVVILAGCDGSLPYTPTTTNYNDSAKVYTGDSSTESYSDEQKVSYDAYGTIETKQYDEDAESVMKLIKDNGGIVLSQNSNHMTDYYTEFVGTQLDIVADIPKDKFQTVVTTLKDQYHIQSFNISSQDVTEQIDNTGETLEIKKERLAEINQKLEDTSLRFSQREELENDKQLLEDEIRSLEKEQSDQTQSVEYSTLTLTVREVKYYSTESLPFWLPFVQVFKYFFNILAWGLVIGLVVALSITPFLLVGSIAYLLIRKHQYKMFHKLKQKMGEGGPINTKEGLVRVDKNNTILLDGEEPPKEKNE